MSVTSRNPLRMAGANTNSGAVNTGELAMTTGGQEAFTCYSGGINNLSSGSPLLLAPVVAADHALLFSGAGRLNRVLPHQAISGVAIVFYDAAVAARSGPSTFTQSGYAVLGLVPANTIGQGQVLGGGPAPIDFHFPFHSGLCVSTPSGAPGFTVSFTKETNLPNPG